MPTPAWRSNGRSLTPTWHLFENCLAFRPKREPLVAELILEADGVGVLAFNPEDEVRTRLTAALVCHRCDEHAIDLARGFGEGPYVPLLGRVTSRWTMYYLPLHVAGMGDAPTFAPHPYAATDS